MSQRHNNNFDLLRIVAALQVVVIHASNHLQLGPSLLINLLSAFPGVPVFFVISGFLVSESFERSDLRSYFMKRALRIYPALWACLVVSIAIAAAWGVSFHNPEFWPWIAAQVSIVQFYNPEFLRGFGVGVLNGSLWTIPVELQFYLLLPALYPVLRRRCVLLGAIAVLLLVNQLFIAWGIPSNTFAKKLAGVVVIPYLYMFLLGVFLQRNRDIVNRYLVGRLPVWITVFVVTNVTLFLAGFNIGGNYLNPLSAIVLTAVVISAAYARPIRVPYDLSYGLYLYHMPVINAFREAGASGSYVAAILAGAISLVLALLSWTLLERPALQFKRRTLKLA